MQVKKENIRLKVVRTARKTFLEKGFSDTSMRTIAKRAGVGLSNIYNYFRDKDEIFQEILSPAVGALEHIINEHNAESNVSLDIFSSQEYLRENTRTFVDLILQYREELNLLLLKSHGSKLEGYKENFIQRHTQIGVEYLRLMKEKYPEVNIDISDFFIHIMSSWWISTLSEIVMHNLERRELERFILEYMEYCTAGWKQIMKVR